MHTTLKLITFVSWLYLAYSILRLHFAIKKYCGNEYRGTKSQRAAPSIAAKDPKIKKIFKSRNRAFILFFVILIFSLAITMVQKT